MQTAVKTLAFALNNKARRSARHCYSILLFVSPVYGLPICGPQAGRQRKLLAVAGGKKKLKDALSNVLKDAG
jgi:hypothetical protein